MEKVTCGVAVISLALATACNPESEGRESSLSGASGVVTVTTGAPSTTTTTGGTTGEGTGDASTSAVAPTGGASEGGGSSAASTGELVPKLDLGEPGVPVPPPAEGCRRVDVLFVIDDSSGTEDVQARLVAGLPAFVQALDAALGGPGVHLGVVTSDAYKYNAAPCDGVLGALVTETGGMHASDRVCEAFVDGRRYLTEADDLTQGLACAAQVGTQGSVIARPIDAAIHALGAGLAAAGECTEGCVRDDARLVLVIVAEGDDRGSDGEPTEWFHGLAGLRGGIESDVVVLTLTGTEAPACGPDVEIGHRLIAFTEMFTYGRVGRICADDFAPFFADSVPAIAEACTGFSGPP